MTVTPCSGVTAVGEVGTPSTTPQLTKALDNIIVARDLLAELVGERTLTFESDSPSHTQLRNCYHAANELTQLFSALDHAEKWDRTGQELQEIRAEFDAGLFGDATPRERAQRVGWAADGKIRELQGYLKRPSKILTLWETPGRN